MRTNNGTQVEMPRMMDCRVDIKQVYGQSFSVLINFITDEALYIRYGTANISTMYKMFKFDILANLPIDNMPSSGLPQISKLPNGTYQF